MITNTADTIQPSHGTDSQLSLFALVPVKVLREAKQRLNIILGPDRRDLTLAMLEDVLFALADSNRIERIAVVTADADVASAAAHLGVLVIDEIEPRGMDAAIKLAIEQIHELGGSHAVVLPADIPLATGEELDRLMRLQEAEQRAGGNGVIGITPSADGRGTNLLCLEANSDFETCYGPSSYTLHLERALQNSRRPVTLESPALSLDIDSPADLQTFIRTCLAEPRFQATETWKFLQAAGLLESFGKTEGG